MNISGNYGITNYKSMKNQVAFGAGIAPALKDKIAAVAKERGLRPSEIQRLWNRLDKVPADVTLQNIVPLENEMTFVRFMHKGDSATFQRSTEGDILDLFRSLIKKSKYGTLLDEYANRIFGI